MVMLRNKWKTDRMLMSGGGVLGQVRSYLCQVGSYVLDCASSAEIIR